MEKNEVFDPLKGNRDEQPIMTEVIDYYDYTKGEWCVFEIPARG